ncbi:MAG: 50S ribosomal protein L9 [Minisyncoccia bacterium]
MKIILLKDVPKVGRRYDIKDVADGYALNMLLPRGLAERATPDKIAKIESVKAMDLADKKIQEELLLKNLEEVKKVTLRFKEKANEKGHLFAGLTREIILAALKKDTKFNIDADAIKLDKPIKEVGDHKVQIEVLGKKAEFEVSVEKMN